MAATTRQEVLDGLDTEIEDIKSTTHYLQQGQWYQDQQWLRESVDKLKAGATCRWDTSVLDVPIDVKDNLLRSPFFNVQKAQRMFFDWQTCTQEKFTWPCNIKIAVYSDKTNVTPAHVDLRHSQMFRKVISGETTLWGFLLGWSMAKAEADAGIEEAKKGLSMFRHAALSAPIELLQVGNNFESLFDQVQCREDLKALGEIESHNDWARIKEVAQVRQDLKDHNLPHSDKDIVNFFEGKSHAVTGVGRAIKYSNVKRDAITHAKVYKFLGIWDVMTSTSFVKEDETQGPQKISARPLILRLKGTLRCSPLDQGRGFRDDVMCRRLWIFLFFSTTRINS